ncbi:hypothetical protein ACIQPR_19470 [Streptomyces sp. NPDC091280]|uniref:hypothetical protein n=1 Tax=Streptomyces sp. NPDC091280 TaxID=3365984 RepID=UPI00381B070E
MPTVNWTGVRERTIALHARRNGPADTALPPALSETQVRRAEEQFGVEFPGDYRAYLLRVSAGGRVRTLRPGPDGWHWDGDHPADLAHLRLPFPDHDTALAASEDVWLAEPREERYASAEDFRAAHETWREAADAAEDARTHGTVRLRDDGCGFSTVLVLGGPMRGTMWFDGRATCDRLNPLLNDDGQPAGFGEWYLDWLTREEALTTPELRRAASDRWHAGTDVPIWLRWFDS